MDQSPGNPEHPSNELHDAAYPISDYQPGNLNLNHNPPGSLNPPGNGDQNTPALATQGNASKYTEIAAPSLAFTSGQASSSWHRTGPSHLDNTLDPPPSYEQSQSHSHSRPTTSSQPSSQPSVSAPSIRPSINSGPPPQSPNPGSPNSTPLRPIPTYYPSQPSGFPSANISSSSSSNGPPTFGPMPAISYQKPEHQSRLARLRRKSCYTTILLVGVFLLALFVGLMIGFRDKLDDDDGEDETKRPGNNQLFKDPEPYPPLETITRTVVYTLIR
ncbi:uncharacterized protein DNG_06581 [Cephalotrichum gorgonifer]|uniref:Uncharacterized protein n=1 Tax=Cephalotrichum gorgonifer TaxID=2041049 RepID=A0AAE8SWP5_9PEZI|nr:uncharacterized protein DNG_06581 [Cephalotrichum gorgonifer]